MGTSYREEMESAEELASVLQKMLDHEHITGDAERE